MSLPSLYQALPKGARFHFKFDGRGRYYFVGMRQSKWIIAGVIAAICLSGSLLMAFVLHGAEQWIYATVSLLLAPFVFSALGMRQHLVFDLAQQRQVEQRSWWGRGVRDVTAIPLRDVRVVVAPIAELDEGCQLELSGQRFTIGSAEDTRQLARFLRDQFGVQAFDRVIAWPQERLLADDIEVVKSPKVASVAMQYVSVWDQSPVMKLFLPFPFFLLAAGLLAWLGN